MAYVWNTPLLLASMCFAFLLNCTAFPMMGGLMPVMAKEIYHTNQAGLGYLIAAGGFRRADEFGNHEPRRAPGAARRA